MAASHAFVWLFALLPLACGEQDDSYYPLGITNPNIQQSHYWKDADLVSEDLFDKLYVSYHNCVWSPMEGDNDDNDGSGEESDSWYLGAGPLYRANAGFTLHGVLVGEREVGCSRRNYVNSFVSTAGAAAFLEGLVAAGVANLTPYVNYNENGDNNQQQQNLQQQSIVSSNCVADDNGGSTTVGCDGAHFALQSFGGGTCNMRRLMDASVSPLEEVNGILRQQVGCVAVYDASVGYQQQQQQQQQQQGEQQGNDGDNDALSILANARACSPHDPLVNCPDPYGKLAQYARTVEHAVSVQVSNEDELLRFRICSTLLLIAGIAMLVGAAVICREKFRKTHSRFRAWRRRWRQKRERARAERAAKKAQQQQEAAEKLTKLEVTTTDGGKVGVFRQASQPQLGDVKKSPPANAPKQVPPEWDASAGSPVLRVFGATAAVASASPKTKESKPRSTIRPAPKDKPLEETPPEWDTSNPIVAMFGSCSPAESASSAPSRKVKDLAINEAISEDPVLSSISGGATARARDGPSLPIFDDPVTQAMAASKKKRGWLGRKR